MNSTGTQRIRTNAILKWDFPNKRANPRLQPAAWNLGITFGGSNPNSTRIQETWAILEIPSSWYMSPVCSDVCVCVLYVFFWVNLILTAYWITFVYIILYKTLYLFGYEYCVIYTLVGMYIHISLAKDDGLSQWFITKYTLETATRKCLEKFTILAWLQ